MDYVLLQQYWFFLVSLLGALLVFLLFVQGGQTLLYTVGKTELEQTMLVNSLGRKWEFTFTTLVTFGGAFFASFPLFYSTSFGGAYWVWMVILFCFILQAVAYEFRSKAGNVLGKKTFEIFLMINGFGGVVLLGAAVGTFFTGSEFIVNKMNLTNELSPAISQWQNPLHGLEAALNLLNLLLGLAVLFLSRLMASLYFINNINDEAIVTRSRKQLLINTVLFLATFLPFLVWVLLKDGYAVDPVSQIVSMQPYKYFFNLIQMPVLLVVLLIGVVSLLFGIIKTLLKAEYKGGIWFAGIGAVLAVLVLFLISGLNNTAYYPSNSDLQSSLTIGNSCSSPFTLTAMSWVSLLIPFVLAYIFYAWRAINAKPIDKAEMTSKEEHLY
ncbi:MAG: cytochrome d ubiquinol oxidase subunit II [Bacteroidales bacterium]